MKFNSVLALVLTFGLAGQVMAQLAADPWANKSPAADKVSQKRSAYHYHCQATQKQLLFHATSLAPVINNP